LRIFLDVNVILDVLAEREPWADASASVMALLEIEEVEGVVAAHTVTTLYYLLSKHLNRKKATAALVDLLNLVSVAEVNEDVILKAISLGWPDLEDAVQAVCALESGADFIITRDAQLFDALSVPAVTPDEFLTLLDASQDEPEA
jgi:predicted nucleic acid-binding protein